MGIDIDLNPFDDKGGPLEVDVIDSIENVIGEVDLLDWEIDINPFDSGELLEIDLVDTTQKLVTAIEQDPIGTIGTIALTMAGVPPWVTSLVMGANTVAQGGSIEDAVKSMVLTYAGAQIGDIAGNQADKYLQQLTNQAGGNLVNPAVANAIGAGTKNAAISLVHGKSPEEIANSFLMGNVASGVGQVLGKIDDVVKLDDTTGFSGLSDGVQNAITAGVTAAIEGGDVTAEAITGLVKGYGEAVIPVAETLQSSLGLNDNQAILITDALGKSMEAALQGGDTTDAFFESFKVNAEKEMKDWVNSPEGLNINKKLDDLFKNTPELKEKADAFNEAGGAQLAAKEAYEDAFDNYNKAITGNNFIANEEKRLLNEYNRLVGVHNSTNSEASFSAATTAKNNLTTFIANNKAKAAQYQADVAKYKPIYNNALATLNSATTTYKAAEAEYQKSTNFILSDIDDLGDEFKPLVSAADMAVAMTIRPQFDPEKYKEALQLAADEDAATHYLSNQADGDAAIAASIAGEYQDVILQLKNGDIDKLPENMATPETAPNVYGAPEKILMPDSEVSPDIDFTVPQKPPSIASGRGGDPRDYGLTPEEYGEYLTETGADFVTTVKDLYQNLKSGGYEAAGYTAGGFGTFADELAENAVEAFTIDRSEADRLAYESLAIQYDPDLTDDEKAEKIANNVSLIAAANAKAEVEQGANITYFTNFTDPLKDTLLGWSADEAKEVSDAMKVRQYNALPHPDTTWEQILSGNAKDRLGRPYGFGDPTATIMSGVQELPDLLVDVALLAITKNPAIMGGVVATTSMAEAGEAASDQIKDALQRAYDSGELQKTPEFADLVRLYDGNMDDAFEKLVDNSMGYAAASGAVGGLGDLILAKVAGASGAASALSVVPASLRPIVKIGTGGVSEGITEATEEIPVNMAQINAGLSDSVGILDGTPVAFLVGTTAGLTTTGTYAAGNASLNAIKNTVKSIADGTYTAPDGSTTAPDQPNDDATDSAADQTLTAIVKYELYTGALNNLADLGAISSDPADSNATEFVSALTGLGFDTDTITDFGNTAYNDDFVTKAEISNTLKTINSAFNPTEEISAAAYEQFGGNKSEADLDALLANFIDPYYFTVDEVKAAAAAEGVTLTDEQAKEYEGQVEDEADATTELVDDLNKPVTKGDILDGGVTSISTDDVQNIVDTAIAGLPDTASPEDVSTAINDAISGLENISSADVDTAINNALADMNNLSADDVQGVVDSAVSTLTEGLTTLETDLTALINENAGDVDTALAELASSLGTTEADILAELGTTTEALQAEFAEGLSGVSVDIAALGADIDAVAGFVGKPAKDVTQADVDFVVDLLAQENVSQELIAQYDVTGDGILDSSDQDLLNLALQGGDVTLANTSMFTPATGLYAAIDNNAKQQQQQQQQQQQTTQDLITNLTSQLATQIDVGQEQQNVNNLMQLLGQSEDIGGQRVTVSNPDPVGNITPYDWQTIFRDTAQAGRYVSPFGGTQANAAQQALNPMSGFGNFAQGGQVEDENDMLLKMLGELK